MSALVVFSGGQDSAVCLHYAKKFHGEVHAIGFNYGQKHSVELDYAKAMCTKYDVPYKVIDISFLSEISVSALTSKDEPIVEKEGHLPTSFVPNRNQLFLTIAHSYAIKIGADTLVTGVNSEDYSGYPDCRKEFIEALQNALNLGSNHTVFIETPLMSLNKVEIWKLASALGVLDVVRDETMTCYYGVETKNTWGMGCGECPSCRIRKKSYEEYAKK